MATNKPIGDNARKVAVRKRTQLKTKVKGEDRWTKRDKGTIHGPEEDCEEVQGRAAGEIGRYNYARVLLAAAVVLLIPTVGPASSVAPEEAASHVGETATVCGMVASANYVPAAPMAPTFIDLGRPYPAIPQ